jgi:hypothetical protein
MVFEDSFVKLMEEIRSEGGEYVGVRKIFPEWWPVWTEALPLQLCFSMPSPRGSIS